MKKIIKFFRLKWIEKQLLSAYKRAVVEAEELLKKWHKVRYDN